MLKHKQDYERDMQSAARGFLRRHLAGTDAERFEQACAHLVNTLEVPAFLAPKLVHQAMTETEVEKRVVIDMAASTDKATVLIDTQTHERAAIPTRWLPQAFLAQA